MGSKSHCRIFVYFTHQAAPKTPQATHRKPNKPEELRIRNNSLNTPENGCVHSKNPFEFVVVDRKARCLNRCCHRVNPYLHVQALSSATTNFDIFSKDMPCVYVCVMSIIFIQLAAAGLSTALSPSGSLPQSHAEPCRQIEATQPPSTPRPQRHKQREKTNTSKHQGNKTKT